MRGGDPGDLTAEDWTSLLELYQNTCAYCRHPLLFEAPPKHPRKATVDHIVPITQGGKNTKANVVPACWQCNSRKGESYIAPLSPPGTPTDSQSPLPLPRRAAHKKFMEVTAAHVARIIELRHAGRTISEIMVDVGITFNQAARQLSMLQKQGRVPIIRRGRRRAVAE